MKSVLREPAKLEVEHWLSAFPNVEAMTPVALAAYPAIRKLQAGWTVDLRDDLGPDGLLNVLLTDSFPQAAPLIAVSKDKYLAVPHVESDGVLCLQDNAATHSAYKPVGVLKSLLSEAVQLVRAFSTVEIQEDFRSEFHSYWNRETTEDDREVYSILEDRPGTRLVSVWPGRSFFVVGEEEQSICTWLTNLLGKKLKRQRYERALLLQAERALIPAEFPKTAPEVASLVREHGNAAYRHFHSLLVTSARPTLLLRAPTRNGTALAMIRLNTDPRIDLFGRQIDKALSGFRRHTIRPALLDTRLLARASRPSRYEISRADAPWVHGRGKDLEAQSLFSKRVVLFGAGSVGAPVAELLAQAGVGELVIVDPERLVFANASRHTLGADSVRLHKAPAVAKLLQKRFPHSRITGVCSSIEDFLRTETLAEEWDLVVSLTGDWPANVLLNEVFLRTLSIKKMLVGWSEANAMAGHAVLLGSRETCMVCGFHHDGLPRLRVADWAESTLESEPACGALFQPYGAVGIASVNAMIAGAALKGLLEPDGSNTHTIYAAEESEIRRSGGLLTEAWIACTPNYPRDIKITKTLAWTKRHDCEACGGQGCS